MSWNKETISGLVVGTESSVTLPDSNGASETSVNSSTIEKDIGDQKILVYVEVTNASSGSDAALDCRIQASLDDSTYVNVLSTVSMDIDQTGTNKAVATADLSGYHAPYWRIQPFTDGTDTGSDATITIGYCTE